MKALFTLFCVFIALACAILLGATFGVERQDDSEGLKYTSVILSLMAFGCLAGYILTRKRTL